MDNLERGRQDQSTKGHKSQIGSLKRTEEGKAREAKIVRLVAPAQLAPWLSNFSIFVESNRHR